MNSVSCVMPYDIVLHKNSAVASTTLFFFSSRRRHTRCLSDWSSDVCSSDLAYPSNLPGAKLAQPDRRNPVLLQITPVAVPDARQIAGVSRVAEPGLRVDLVRIIVRRVDQPVGGVEPHRVGLRAHHVTAPPVAIDAAARDGAARPIAIDAFNDDQPIGIHG